MNKKRHTVIPRTMCLVFDGDKVSLIKASKEKEFHGYYGPPGGHIEKGESVIENAEKEILEETGLQVKNSKLRGVVHVSGFYGKEIMLFVVSSEYKSGDLISSREGTPEWISIDKLDSVNLMEDLKPIIKHVIEVDKEKLFFGVSTFDGTDKLTSFDVTIN